MSDVCGRGTLNGAAAEAAKYQFSACVRPKGHGGACDSGPVEAE